MKNKEPTPIRIYWDSCVYIHRIQKTKKYIETLALLGNRIESKELIVVASTLCIAEVSKNSKDPKMTANQLRKIQSWFYHSYVEMYPVTRTIAEYAAELVRVHPVKPPDAIHLATAVLSDFPVHEFHTYETGLISLSGKLGASALRICYPNNDGWQGKLFDK